jgi:RNA polymerase sigma-70 factor, ECF subfamily
VDDASTMKSKSDGELVTLAREGNRDALATLLARHRPVVMRHLQRYPLDAAERQDALQDAMLQVVRKLESFRGDAQFSTWLYRVTANAVLMRMRSERRRRARSLDDEALDAEAAEATITPEWCDRADTRMHRLEVTKHVERAVAALPEHYRVLVQEHYVDGQPLEAMAQTHATSESAVRSRLHRARTELRKRLLPLFDTARAESSAA